VSAGKNVQAVRDALLAMRTGKGDYEAVKATVEQAQFAPRPTARSEEELADAWEYTPVEDSFTDTVSAARWQRVLTREQERELRGMAKFVGPDATRLTKSTRTQES